MTYKFNKFYYKPLPENLEVRESDIEGSGVFAKENNLEGAEELINGETGQGLSKLLKALPYMKLWFLKDTVNEIGYYLNDTDFDFDKVNRSRF